MEQHKPVANIDKKREAFARALGVMQTLRSECPWDAKQDNESIRQNTIEETYELAEALIKGDAKEIQKECGDVLEQILFYAMFGEEKGLFDIGDVCNAMCDKLVFRHPHVFNPDGSLISEVGARNGVEVDNADEVSKLWEVVKQKEKDGNKTILSGIPSSLPSLVKAYRIQDKARGVGFDWEQKEDVWAKVKEEEGELERELRAIDAAESDEARNAAKDRAEDELGDMIFALVNAGRLYKLNPDTALEKTCAKFRRRFTYLEEHTIRQGRDLKDMTLAQMDEIWDEAKKLGL